MTHDLRTFFSRFIVKFSPDKKSLIIFGIHSPITFACFCRCRELSFDTTYSIYCYLSILHLSTRSDVLISLFEYFIQLISFDKLYLTTFLLRLIIFLHHSLTNGPFRAIFPSPQPYHHLSFTSLPSWSYYIPCSHKNTVPLARTRLTLMFGSRLVVTYVGRCNPNMLGQL